MEFRFDLHPIFNQSIIKVNSNLLPVGFRGDRRLALDTATKMAEIINEMGSASARAQGLSNPVTTAQKLRMTDQNIYLLGDPNQGRNGAVVGLLKVGKKSLYVFDQNGQTQMVNAPCVLDFYVHESRQRSGLGRNLFDTMLQQEDFVPQKLAVDRPSDKLLGFLRKHYGLQKTIPQMNNFVVYDGFFEKPKPQENNVTNHDGRMHITASPNTALFGPQFINDEQNKRSKAQQNASNTSIPLIQNSPVGRYAAPRPMCSMAEIIHNTATPATGEPNSTSEIPSATEPYHAVINETVNVNTVNVNIENLQLSEHEDNEEHEHDVEEKQEEHQEQHHEDLTNGHDHKEKEVKIDPIQRFIEEQVVEPIVEAVHIQKPTSFPLSKQHTGLKNISYNVSLAVSPTNKMEFIQKGPNDSKHDHPDEEKPAGLPSHENIDEESATSSPGSGGAFTDQGYFDLKFYHNKLW